MLKTESTKPVIIVGAGLAGLQAAYQSQMQSIPYLLIEKSGEVGGRIQTERLDGFLLDVGFQVLQTSYPGVQRNLDLSDLNLNYFESGANVWMGDQFVPFLNPLKHPFSFFDSLGKGVITVGDAIKLAKLWFKIQIEIDPTRAGKLNVNQYIHQLINQLIHI
jgi:phytoene dehydrogenase-like protein